MNPIEYIAAVVVLALTFLFGMWLAVKEAPTVIKNACEKPGIYAAGDVVIECKIREQPK